MAGRRHVGFWIAELSVLLTARHRRCLSGFRCCSVSIRSSRHCLRFIVGYLFLRTNPGMPDAARAPDYLQALGALGSGFGLPQDRVIRNALTAPYLWVLTSVTVIGSTVLALRLGTADICATLCCGLCVAVPNDCAV